MDERAFFEQMRSCREAYRRLADCIHEVIVAPRVRSILEIGCGVGDMVERWTERGWKAFGCDSTFVALSMCPKTIRVYRADLTSDSDAQWRGACDIVICTETAEHIDQLFSDRIVSRVAIGARDTIVWSAAQPGQEWEGHVNLQPPSYWLDKFAAHGWVPDHGRTLTLRSLMLARHAQHEYAADNFYILKRAP